MKKDNKLTVGEKLSFSATAIGKNLVYFLVATYYMFYLTQIQMLSGTVVGVVFGITRVFDALNDPLMGTIADNTKSRFGKYRPYIFLGTILNAVVLVLMFLPLQNSGIVFKYIFYLFLYVLWGMTYTVMDVPYWSMIPSIALNSNEKNSVSAFSQIAAGLGTIVIVGGMPEVFKRYGSSTEPNAYLYPSIVIGIVFIILTIITVAFVREKKLIDVPKIRFKEIFRILYRNDQLIAYIMIMLSILTATTLLTSFATYFFSFVLKDYTLKLFGTFTIIAGLSQFAGMASFPAVARRFNKLKIFYFAGVSSIIGLTLMFVLTLTGLKDNIVLLSLVGIVILFGFGWMMVISIVMLADIVDYGENKTGDRTESIVFSMKTLVQKFGAALSAVIVGIAIDLAGISGKEAVDFVMTSRASIILRITMFLIPILLILTGLLVYRYKYTLDVQDKDKSIVEE